MYRRRFGVLALVGAVVAAGITLLLGSIGNSSICYLLPDNQRVMLQWALSNENQLDGWYPTADGNGRMEVSSYTPQASISNHNVGVGAVALNPQSERVRFTNFTTGEVVEASALTIVTYRRMQGDIPKEAVQSQAMEGAASQCS